MTRYAKHLLGGTAVEVTALGLGCVTLGSRR
jgi:aryl-alcohol dehydrogenase-like predicted oxidoreductase